MVALNYHRETFPNELGTGGATNPGAAFSFTRTVSQVVTSQAAIPCPSHVENDGDRDRTYPIVPPSLPMLVIKTNLARSGILYEDPAFPTDRLILPAGSPAVVWRRPAELISVPMLISKGGSTPTMFGLGVAYRDEKPPFYLGSLAGMAANRAILCRVVDPTQSFCPANGYTGAFSFLFYVSGSWRSVTIDDRLPTLDNQLVFLRSSKPDEFWPSLVEKALAKLFGGYANLSEATFEETANYLGAVVETLEVAGEERLEERIKEAVELKSNVVAYRRNSHNPQLMVLGVTWCERGLKVLSPVCGGGRLQTIDWTTLATTATHVHLAHHTLHSVPGAGWVGRGELGVWWPTTSTGVSGNFPTFLCNPEYQVVVGEGASPVTLLVALDLLVSAVVMTEDGSSCSRMEKYAMGFTIHPSRLQGHRLQAEEVGEGSCLAHSGPYRFEKHIVGRYRVSSGSYTIIPRTHSPGLIAELSIRVLAPHSQSHRVTFIPPSPLTI